MWRVNCLGNICCKTSKKALQYFNRMGKGSELQLKHANQKLKVDYLVALLE
jgi:hypothetical protein